MVYFSGVLFRVLYEKTQGNNLKQWLNYELEQNLWIYPIIKQYRDFIKIMIKYKEFKQYWIQQNQFFFPNHSPHMTNSGPGRGKQSLNLTSLSTHKKSKEEDNIGVLTVPNDLKEIREVEQKNWLKY